MKANELRIGNWIEQSGKHYQLDENSLIDVLEYWKINKMCLHNSIPLTEEWLLKFGFVKERGSYIMGVHQSRFSGLMKFKFDPLIQWVFSVGKYKDITRVKFVHELQNLYFALTGEELTIKTDI